MPAPVYSAALELYFCVHRRASDLLDAVGEELRARPLEANLILPLAEKLAAKEREGKDIPSDQLWISCWSMSPGHPFDLDFVLSCTSHEGGNYPIFLFSNHPTAFLTPNFLNARIPRLAIKLRGLVDQRRVYSIFAPLPLAKAMAKAWTVLTGMPIESQPYYSATSTFCTRETFKRPEPAPQHDPRLRLASLDDLHGVARLCLGFSEESPPFVLNYDEALEEARNYIVNKMAWVHEVSHGVDQVTEIASIVAVTRTSETVACITKVYTNPVHRGQGCALRLVQRVLQHLLYEIDKEKVMLFVGHGLAAARSVYSRAGFIGLDSAADEHVDGVEDWLELGFVGAELGHW